MSRQGRSDGVVGDRGGRLEQGEQFALVGAASVTFDRERRWRTASASGWPVTTRLRWNSSESEFMQ